MTQIKLRRDTSANFTSKNPVLGVGEPAYETDTKKLKIGDGTTAYTQLEYFSAGGGGSTNISATLPLKIVDGVISLEVDGQTIQIVDGKLTASSTAPSNMVTTDTKQTITGNKEFKYGRHRFIINQVAGVVGIASGENSIWDLSTLQLNNQGSASWAVGAKSKEGYIYATSLTRNDGNSNNAILDAGNLGSYVDGTTITYTNNKLSAAGGGSAPANMVTTDTSQDITGTKSFTTGKITFKNTDSNRKILGEINGNGFYCNYYTDKASGEKPCYLGKVSRDTFNMGIPDLTGVEGRIFAKNLTKWDGTSQVGTILSTDNFVTFCQNNAEAIKAALGL